MIRPPIPEAYPGRFGTRYRSSSFSKASAMCVPIGVRETLDHGQRLVAADALHGRKVDACLDKGV